MKWAFVSDFDGTISKKDFYWIIIEKYFPEGHELFKRWKDGEMKDIEFLSTVFASIFKEEEEIKQEILTIPIDEHVPSFIRRVQENGGDFYILSAGTDYYINHVLEKYGITGVEVFSNKGFFREKNIHLNIDESHNHFSERYGIDKAKVIQSIKEKYDVVYFAGDSEPDSHAVPFADLTFAKDALIGLLKEKEAATFFPVSAFKDIEDYLTKNGVLSS
ncbi:MtnX-like HAD-IB family phosphatase [Evansella clarkii]|uniref:MtnX-like HAD-IB family phosphatase n=1 Tax=Evansella clarkii TaxID=79879 RepID=UPI000B44B6A6|nr:MtnX-like HAD-IB family phosphatase [Evansella clarkii]